MKEIVVLRFTIGKIARFVLGGANDLLRVGAIGDRPPRSRLEDTGCSGPVEVGEGLG